jgi:hypothetical protein
MLYRSNMESVRWPLIFFATVGATPERIRFRTAVRRVSWKVMPALRPGVIPTALHAAAHASRTVLGRNPDDGDGDLRTSRLLDARRIGCAMQNLMHNPDGLCRD